MLLLAFFVAAGLVLAALAWMILAIARVLGDCPDNAPRARAAGITIATGYLALGSGAVLLLGAFASLDPGPEVIFFCLGLACVVLGLGFTHAITLLRAVVDGVAKPRLNPLPEAAAPVPMEPVLA
jgi:hypothetical protein